MKYICEYCKKTTAIKNNEAVYECQSCEKKYHYSYKRTSRHKMTHTVVEN